MLAVDATGLEALVFVLGGTLPVVAFVVTATAIVAELALLVPAMLTMMMLSEIASCASCASIQIKSTMRLLDGGTHYHREAHQILQ